MNRTTQLRGITWDHGRAFPPLVAASERYEEIHPSIRIEWKKRTLHEFGHQNVKDLASSFDLIVIDHPWAGFALAEKAVHDLRPLLPPGFLEELRANSTGPSFSSYEYEGALIALPIDGATPTASCRPDLLDRLGLPHPRKWADVVSLARRGWVGLPGFHVDQLLNLVGLAVSLGGRAFESEEHWIDRPTGRNALEAMRELMAHVPPEVDPWNPVRMYEEMADGDRFAYCPFAYSYNNYSRRGYAAHLLTFHDTVRVAQGANFRSVLGGTGLAISTRTAALGVALDFLQFVAGVDCQRSLYVEHGGQPAHRIAWLDPEANRLTTEFFRNTLRTMEEAYVRPRYCGFIGFPEGAGLPLVRYYRQGGKPDVVLDEMDEIYRQSILG
jgi:multiple sugar transport system substrate-binding protein